MQFKLCQMNLLIEKNKALLIFAYDIKQNSLSTMMRMKKMKKSMRKMKMQKYMKIQPMMVDTYVIL